MFKFNLKQQVKTSLNQTMIVIERTEVSVDNKGGVTNRYTLMSLDGKTKQKNSESDLKEIEG